MIYDFSVPCVPAVLTAHNDSRHVSKW